MKQLQVSVELPELQTRMAKQRFMTTREQRRETAYIREDLRVPQAMPTADKILFADAYAWSAACATRILRSSWKVISSSLCWHLSADKSAPLQQLERCLSGRSLRLKLYLLEMP